MKHRYMAIVLFAAAALMVPAVANAQVDWGVRAGLAIDRMDPMIGVEAIMPLTGDFFFNPNIEHVFGDSDYTSVNADVHYDFDLRQPGRFLWVGAGAALLLADDTDFGANLFAGYSWGRTMTRGMSPYVQAKVVLADDTEGILAAGLRF